jgi:hypothetical protein
MSEVGLLSVEGRDRSIFFNKQALLNTLHPDKRNTLLFGQIQ